MTPRIEGSFVVARNLADPIPVPLLVDGESVDVNVDDFEVPDDVSAALKLDIEVPLLVELGGSTSVEVVCAAPLAAKARLTALPRAPD